MPEIVRSRLEFPSREKMTGWALTRWRALTRYSTVIIIYVRIRSFYKVSKSVTKVIGVGVHICLWTKKKLNRTLVIDSPFQTFAVGLFDEL